MAPDETLHADEKLREYLKRVTIDLHDARRRLREVERQSREPVAIVGMACRYPGGVRSPDDLWELVRRGEDAMSGFPANRGWDLESLYHPDPQHRGTCYADEGGFVYDADEFDAAFFNISPREALAMDPKQRLLLELAWEAFEDADIDPLSLKGSRTGVFAGVNDQEYSTLSLRNPAALAELEGYIGIGAALSVVSGRVSYTLGLEGPALTVDTACSSSLVALHLACAALRAGECTLALAGGATIMVTPSIFVEFARQRGLAADGRCKSFADAADGAGWGEGLGVLVLERLSDAQRNGHPVLAVVRASAVNQDGASNGLTAPSGPSQQRVIRDALAGAGLSGSQVDLLEAHGTGTTLGDPIEAQALLATYGAERDPDRPLWLGSIKSNIGHTMAAAGVAGVIKAVMAIRHGVLPKTLHVDAPSSNVDWSVGSVSLLCAERPWESGDEPRRAGVSSFGMSGTNAHVILEEAPPLESGGGHAETDVLGAGATAFLLSSRSPTALSAQAEKLCELLGSDELDEREVAAALARKAQLEQRAVVVGATREEMLAGLGALAKGDAGANLHVGETVRPGAVFMFPGQGSQWPGMARALLDCSPPFRARIGECDLALREVVDWGLEDVLRGVDGAPDLEGIDVLQPVLFAVMLSLAELWRACGVQPSVVIGHSQGEIAAAYVAGALTLEDAARVVALRSRMQAAHEGHGGMMSISAPMAQVRELIERWDGEIVVAAMNGPQSMVLAGGTKALAELVDACDAAGIRARRIKAARGASHSPQVEPLREELLEALASIEPRKASVPFCSTVTGALFDTQGCGAEYWYRNMREPVLFEPAVRGLLEEGQRSFIEISAHPVLALAVQETIEECSGQIEVLAEEPAGVVGSLRRDQGGAARFLTSLGEAWTRGVEVDWRAVLGAEHGKQVRLPPYAFQRERYWVQPTEPMGGAPSLLGSEPDALGAGQDAATPGAGDFAARLRSLDESARQALALDLVRSLTAGVLGFATPDRVDQRKAFRELGFDSLMAVDLRNRVQSATGLTLDSTLAFSQPTPAALARFLVAQATGAPAATAARPMLGSDEPIAIVGIGCRYPGGVRSPQELWQLLAAGRDAVGEFPSDRGWQLDELYDPDPATAGKCYVREAGFLCDVADFDASFFGISPREALAMDPQQRHLLETCWEALEDAELDPQALRGTQTGVYIGCAGQDYSAALVDSATAEFEGYRAAGGMTSMASGRVAYLLGLEGPAVSVDTACSSSLVALHLACQALRGGECSLALAGGATIMSSPLGFVEASRVRALAPDGRCKAFSSDADGTGFAEGVGVIALERLSDAQRNGREILAVIRGSAINQDGASNGLTAPNGAAQERVILQALANAGVSAEEVDAVEAHGTGTELGDPIEAHALLATYGRARPAERPLWLGSIKSNIGHTAAAAGIAGVIKMTLALRHQALPRTLHVQEPSPHVNWSAGAVSLLSEERAWPADGRARRAGISSFGASGTNAHVIVEEAPARKQIDRMGPRPAGVRGDAPEQALQGEPEMAQEPEMAEEQPIGDKPAIGLLAEAVPWLLSAKSEGALSGQAARLSTHVEQTPQLAALDVGASLVARGAFEHRAAALGDTREKLLGRLGALARNESAAGAIRAPARRDTGRIAFLFPGQGAQWEGMASALMDGSPVFAQQIRACAQALAPFVDWSLEDVLRGVHDAPSLERLDVVQPALFAMMVSLASLWRACGVEPDVVVGHSQGEIAAACVAGGLSLRDGARIVALRSKLLMALEGRGAMMSIAAPRARVEELLERFERRIVVAALNGPCSLVLAGENEALSELVGECDRAGIRTRMVKGGGRASHSPQMEELREELLGELATIEPQAGEIAFCSTVTGHELSTEQLDAEYWYRNMREPVQFEPAIRRLLQGGVRTFVEASAHPVLAVAMQENLEAVAQETGARAQDVGRTIGSLRREQGGSVRFLTSLAEAWIGGVEVDWGALFAELPAKRVKLPTYAFQRRRYWVAPRAAAALSAAMKANEPPAQDCDDRLQPSVGELARRLASAQAEQRETVAIEFLLAEAAAVLGYESAADLDGERAFLELGFDSLTALELRNRLGSATGLSLPNALALDHPTPCALARYLAGRWDEMDAGVADVETASTRPEAHVETASTRPEAHVETAPTRPAPRTRTTSEALSVGEASGARGAPAARKTGAVASPETGGMLSELFAEAHGRGALADFMELLMSASRFRAVFDRALSDGPASVMLSDGERAPRMLCFPSAVATSGPHEYALFARALDDRKLSVLPSPGYASGEPLPASLEVLAQGHADAVRRHAGEEPFVLAGHSSGGLLAHAVAERLESEGVLPAAVVLLDTYLLDMGVLLGLLDAGFANEDARVFVNDRRLTAMGAYLRLLSEWAPTELAAPVLLARASEPVPGIEAHGDWRCSWQGAHQTIDLPGHHFTLLREHADTTAGAIDEWLSTMFDQQGVMEHAQVR